MHQPVSEPRRSIYYAYRVHPAAAVPAAGHDLAPVVVVGAGPIGLVTALDLARRGVRCVLLESELQVSEGSRAIVFTRRSMEILQQVGADAAVTRQGLPWRFGNSFYGTRRVFRMEAPRDPNDRFLPMINLQQQYLEEALVDLVDAQPLIEMRWGTGSSGCATAQAPTTPGSRVAPVAPSRSMSTRRPARTPSAAAGWSRVMAHARRSVSSRV